MLAAVVLITASLDACSGVALSAPPFRQPLRISPTSSSEVVTWVYTKSGCRVLRSRRTAPPNMVLEGVPVPLLEFGSWYMHNLDVNPIITKVSTAGALAMTGDLIAQSVEPGPYDSKRGLSFGLFDALYRGGFQHFLFPVINGMFHGTILLRLLPSVNVELLAAIERTFANQLVVSRCSSC